MNVEVSERSFEVETARIDALVAKVREAIERLKELRTALISAAVTGKIDVWEDAAAYGMSGSAALVCEGRRIR